MVAIGDIDGDGLTDILRCDGANVSVTRWLPAPQPQQGTWQSTLVPIDAADVKAMAILPARGLLARFALAKGSSNTTQVVKMTTNLATPSPTATDTWTVSVQPNDVRGVLPLSEAGQDLLFLHTNDGVWALDDLSHTTTKVLDGNFVGFEFAALGGDDGKDLVSWRKIDTKTVIEYRLLPRTTTPQ